MEEFTNKVWSQQRAAVERLPAALNLRRMARLLAPESVRRDLRRPA